jgi:hypothetical protein
MSPPPTLHLFQIAYSAETRAMVGPGFEVLDNLDNQRPDWYEYWPIRRFLLGQALDEAAFYGFFSPKFTFKTTLTASDVRAMVQLHAAKADVLLFSPQPDMGAFFLNVFEQGATFDPQLIDVTQRLLQAIGRPAPPLNQLVMDSRQIVFSNYFVARPAFWREWLAINEALFAICEGPPSALKADLEANTLYRGGAQRKVFVMERMASLLLSSQPRWRSRAANPYTTGWSRSRLARFPHEAAMSDALKIAWREQRFPQFMEAFGELRERMHERMLAMPSEGGATASPAPGAEVR